MNMRKFRAILIASLLILNAYGIIYCSVAQTAFVHAASDTYTVTNIIYINATGMSKAPHELIRLEISESTTLDPKPTPPIVKGVGNSQFTPDTDVDTARFITNAYERTSGLETSFEFAGNTYIFNNTDATTSYPYLFAGQLGNGTLLPVNFSTWTGSGFETPQWSFPAMEKMLVFDSPLHYAAQYCADHGYVLLNIVNSTYQRTYNMNTLNLFHSELLKENMIVYNTNTTPTMSMAMDPLLQHGGGLIEPQELATGTAILIGFLVAAILVFFVTPVVITWINNEYALNALNAAAERNAAALADSVAATKAIADSLAGNKAAERAMVLEFFANNTITWEQMQFLLQQIDNSYNPLIDNCTVNIAAMTAAYFNSTVELYGQYTNGLMDATSWTSWITPLITLIITLVVAYCVYALVSKIRGASAPAQTINLTHL